MDFLKQIGMVLVATFFVTVIGIFLELSFRGPILVFNTIWSGLWLLLGGAFYLTVFCWIVISLIKLTIKLLKEAEKPETKRINLLRVLFTLVCTMAVLYFCILII